MGWNALMGRNPQSRTQRLRELGDPPGYRSYPEPQRAAWGRRWQPSSFPLKEALCGAEQRSTQPCNPGTEDRKGAALIGGHSAFIGRCGRRHREAAVPDCRHSGCVQCGAVAETRTNLTQFCGGRGWVNTAGGGRKASGCGGKWGGGSTLNPFFSLSGRNGTQPC